MADFIDDCQGILNIEYDTTTPDQDASSNEIRAKKQYPRRHRKKNVVTPEKNTSQNDPSCHLAGLRLQPIETSNLRGKDFEKFTELKRRVFGTGEGKLPEVIFETTASDEYIDGNSTITSSYPSITDTDLQENRTNQKSSQETQSNSLTILSSTSPELGTRQHQRDSYNEGNYYTNYSPDYPPKARTIETQKKGVRHAFWWEAYNSQLVNPFSTCLLVRQNKGMHEPSHHYQIIDHFIAIYKTLSFSTAKRTTMLSDKQIDLEFIAKCLDHGVDIDQTDVVGQTILMEAVRSWHLDVIRYLLENEAKVTHQDMYGRAPIHVAAASNRPAVIHLLLDEGAYVNLKVKHSGETPLHLAARRGALLSTEALLDRNADIEATDYKARTPLYIAAQFGCGDMVDLLMKNGASPKSVSDDGFSCVTHIIMQCQGKTVERALDSLILHCDMSEKGLFDPDLFEPSPVGWEEKVGTNCLLDVIESHTCHVAIRHSVIQTMIKKRWKLFGRPWAVLNFICRFVFVALWSFWILTIHWEEKYKYVWPSHWWRVLLLVLCIISFFWEIKIEVFEFWYSFVRRITLAKILLASLQTDLKKLPHPRWKDEIEHIQEKLKVTRRVTQWLHQFELYLRDPWNLYDFCIFIVILSCLFTHVSDYFNHDLNKARVHGRLGSITILLLGIRLMKDTMGFFGPGRLVIMLGLMASDFCNFIFLYLQLYVPFTIAFWIIFGGVRHPHDELCQFNCSAPANCTTNCSASSFLTYLCDLNIENCVSNRTSLVVAGMEDYPSLCFSLFRLTLVDEYDLEAMRVIDPVLSLVLVCTFLLTSAVVGINFLIGLISNVLGDGARENVEVRSLLQKLKALLLIERTSYILGPIPKDICLALSKDLLKIDLIIDSKRDKDFSIREGLTELQKSMAKLKRVISNVSSKQEAVLAQSLELKESVLQLSRNTLNEPTTFNNTQFNRYDTNPISMRSASRALKCQTGFDLSISCNNKIRDVDAPAGWRMSRDKFASEPQSVTINAKRRSRSTSPTKRVQIKD